MRRVVSLLLIVAALQACGPVSEGIRIGSKDFTEQRILAQMMVLMAEAEGVPVQRIIPVGDSRSNLYAIQNGLIDVYPDYTGTIIALSGYPPRHDLGAARGAVRELVNPLGLRWVGSLGFSNDFVVVVRKDFAFRNDVRTVSDLADLGDRLRLAVDTDFAERPVDGLTGLIRLYGLRLASVLEVSPGERGKPFEALLEGRVDAAVVFMTDPEIATYGVSVLEDNLDFFASYEAGVLARSEVLQRLPKLAAALKELTGRISAEEMRRMIGEVDYVGDEPKTVARRFLVREGLLSGEVEPTTDPRAVSLTIDLLDDRGTLPIDAARAIRQVMPGRRLVVEADPRPDRAVLAGESRFALLGAESFFTPPPGTPRLVEGLEAVGVAGTHMAHLLTRAGADKGPVPPGARVAVGVAGSASYLVTRHMLHILGIEDQVTMITAADPDERVRLLDAGEVDAALFMAEPGHPWLATLLESGTRALRPVEAPAGESYSLRFPFLRPARIPAATYANQPKPLPTVASQVVLAAVATPAGKAISDTGPQIVPGLGDKVPRSVPPATARRLDAALPSTESVDPLLPSSPGLNPRARDGRISIAGNPLSAVLNVLAVAFLVWMIRLYFTAIPPVTSLRPDGGGDGRSDATDG